MDQSRSDERPLPNGDKPVKRILILLIFTVLVACNLPFLRPPASTVSTVTTTPGEDRSNVQCAFVEARQPNPELTTTLIGKLKDASLPVVTARAESYGENCIAADNSIVRFARRETDFYITLNTQDLSDEVALGELIENTLTILNQFPREQLGPSLGYVGITFQAGSQSENLWFMQTKANDLISQGTTGAALYQALNHGP